MIGGIAGDCIGSRYEGKIKASTPNFRLFTKKSHFTDDSVHIVAVADSILNNKNYADTLKDYYKRYPYVGYGKGFRAWAESNTFKPYNSYGNGSAMRVSPVAYIFDNEEDVLKEAKRSAICTHDHENGVKGAQAIALAIFMARKGASREDIYEAMTKRMGYNLLNVPNGFFSSCQESIPQALVAFFESYDYIDAVRRAVMFMGDSDTLACIAGSIAQEYYRKHGLDAIPQDVILKTFERLPKDLSSIIVEFIQKYIDKDFKKTE
jgi:ADP-ribosylglycohydrolase